MKSISLAASPHELRTDRLTLTRLRIADADELMAAIFADRAWLEPHIPLPQDRDELLASLVRLEATDSRVRYLVRTREGVLVGCVGLDARQDRPNVALSYWLLSKQTKRGYANEAAAMMCKLALEATECEALEIDHAATNEASARVARALGFAVTLTTPTGCRWLATRALLPSWHHTKETLQTLRPLTQLGDHGLLRVSLDDETSAEAWVSLLHAEAFVSLRSVVGSEGRFTSRELLAHNATLAVGSLELAGDQIVFRFTCPAAGLTPTSAALVLHEAARLRSLIPPPRVSLDAFAAAL